MKKILIFVVILVTFLQWEPAIALGSQAFLSSITMQHVNKIPEVFRQPAGFCHEDEVAALVEDNDNDTEQRFSLFQKTVLSNTSPVHLWLANNCSEAIKPGGEPLPARLSLNILHRVLRI